MSAELSLTFPDAGHVQVALRLNDAYSEAPGQPFAPPLDAKTREELTWYLEIYPVHYTTEIDDVRAAAISERLKTWGGELFEAVFATNAARRLYERFRDVRHPGRLLTVRSLHPAVLAQPWELLCDPEATHLFLENPRISIRRRPPDSGREPHLAAPKDRLRLLFVVSRPSGEGFIDPRADPMAVMDALDQEAHGRVDVEFLRPPTLDALIRRLDNDRLPPIDILHFDGHGAYDPDGRLKDDSRKAVVAASAQHLLRDTQTGAAHQGYLLFEDETHKSAFVSAADLGDLLQSKQVGLVVLSACQSAMVSGEDALGSVAPRLIRAGIPSVLAMTQSVLVATTGALSRSLYRELATARPIGAALDAARAQLYFHPKRGERQRAAGPFELNLRDWFVPALYQAGADGALFTPGAAGEPAASAAPVDNLPAVQDSGFHGRRRELWDIERWFVDGVRRVVVTGFGGQGKTALATEAGRWLLRTGLFGRVCFVTYAGFQGSDPLQAAVGTLATVLNVNLIDAEAALAPLRATPTLLILDNLESLEEAPRAELLTATARWSGQGGSRVLITTRPDELGHPDYPVEGSKSCRPLALDGLAPADALDWFQALLALPPEPSVPIPRREAVEELFAQVRFHPLSIGVLTQLLKQQRVADVAETLRARLRDERDPLRASLDLSIARLDAETRAALPGLGVFIDGALDATLADVLEIDPPRWARLRDGLRRAGLVTIETIPGIDASFVRFHPTLAPAMRDRLTAEALAGLSERRRRAYYQLSSELYQEDFRHPEIARAIARRELPNLLASVFEALDRGEAYAADFADKVGRFLRNFGRGRDLATLQARAERAANEPGSDGWYLTQSNRGEHLYGRGQFAAAAAVCEEILRRLGTAPSYRREVTLSSLARCRRNLGELGIAEDWLLLALRELATLAAGDDVRRLERNLHADLGDVLRYRGDLSNAETEHQTGVEISAELGDQRGVAVGNGQLGSIYLAQGQLARAASSFRKAIVEFETLGEPRSVATGYHQLGITLWRAGDLGGAEQAYRQSAQLIEGGGDRLGAARTWMNLAVVVNQQGRPIAEVEPWFRKALAVFGAENDRASKAIALNNLAELLRTDAARLSEARELAEQALAIKETLDPGAAEIWKTHEILADIADAQGDAGAARDWRARARQSHAAAPISRETLRQHRPLIGAVLLALREPAARPALDQALDQLATNGWTELVVALRGILDGRRDEDALCESLDREDSLIVHTILHALDHPDAAREFLAPNE
jgi:tetratricopeptide (TPR) repeat protein